MIRKKESKNHGPKVDNKSTKMVPGIADDDCNEPLKPASEATQYKLDQKYGKRKKKD